MQNYNRPQMKAEVKNALKDYKWVKLLIALVIFGAISAVLPGIGGILASPILVGVYFITKDVLNHKDVDYSNIFDAYKDINKAVNFGLLYLVKSIFIFLWSLLFIIPGIIASYSYALTTYIWAENQELGFMDALKRSKEIMRGHKMELFIYDLSFIGHWCLFVITFGIYGIYFFPLMTAARLRYYQYLVPRNKSNLIE